MQGARSYKGNMNDNAMNLLRALNSSQREACLMYPQDHLETFISQGLNMDVYAVMDKEGVNLEQGARFATAAYLRQTAKHGGIQRDVRRLMAKSANLLTNPAPAEGTLESLEWKLQRRFYANEENRRGAELAQTALKSPLHLPDVLSAALELEMALNAKQDRDMARISLHQRLAMQTLAKSVPAGQVEERARMGLNRLLSFVSRGR